jgi:hypothetical protein
MPRGVVLGGLLLAVLALVAGAQTEKKAKAKVYKTPRAVFEAEQAALKKSDYKAVVALFTREGQKDLAVDLALMGLDLRAGAAEDSKLKKKAKPVLDVLEKYGLTEQATKKIKPPRSAKEAEAMHRAVEKLIEKPAAFAAAYMAAEEKAGLIKKPSEAKLTGLKIEGNRAHAVVVETIDGEEDKRPMAFAKVGEGWKLVIPKGAPPKGKDKGKE